MVGLQCSQCLHSLSKLTWRAKAQLRICLLILATHSVTTCSLSLVELLKEFPPCNFHIILYISQSRSRKHKKGACVLHSGTMLMLISTAIRWDLIAFSFIWTDLFIFKLGVSTVRVSEPIALLDMVTDNQ